MTYDLTPLQRAQLVHLATAWRRIAQPVGPLHAWWDYIFDVEAILNGGWPMLKETADEFIKDGRDGLVRWGYVTAEQIDAQLAAATSP